jgi:hypothetical protein
MAMKQCGRWRRLAHALVAAGLLGGAGCLGPANVLYPPPEQPQPCHLIPKCARDHVYVFLVHGVDPLDCADLTGLRDHVQDLGFGKTYYGKVYHAGYFGREIRRIHSEDAEARFVLVGYSFGTRAVCDLARSLNGAGINVDLLVYLDGARQEPADGPSNDRVCHLGAPADPSTVQGLAQCLAAVAASVPVILPAATGVEPEAAPVPRPVTAPPPEHGPEWDFLKPVTQLGEGG